MYVLAQAQKAPSHVSISDVTSSTVFPVANKLYTKQDEKHMIEAELGYEKQRKSKTRNNEGENRS